jgi:ElaB/YqjD/DUF883 family membrane-anchored ribosome-binding protein
MTDTISQNDATDSTLEPTLSPRPDLAAAPSDMTYDRAPATARIERGLREGRTWAENRSHRAGEAIRAHPLRSSLGAVGVGVVLGMLLRR